MATTKSKPKTKVRPRKTAEPPATRPGVTPLAPEADLAQPPVAPGPADTASMKTEHDPSDGRFAKKGGGGSGSGRTRTRSRSRGGKASADRSKARATRRSQDAEKERKRVGDIQKIKSALGERGITGIPRSMDPATRSSAQVADAPMLLTAHAGAPAVTSAAPRVMAAPPAPAFNPQYQPTPAVTLAAPDRVKPWR